MRVPIVAGLLAILLVPVLAADDPWVGRSRDEVVAALGEPDKAKEARGGGETLVYRFFRLREGAVPGPRMTPVAVEGIGALYRVVPDDLEPLEYEPTGIDADGRPVAGGPRSNFGGSTSYDAGTGAIERDWDDDDTVDVAGKVKLTLTLDPSGRVTEWKVAPKDARAVRPSL